jgi:hypothetical protein
MSKQCSSKESKVKNLKAHMEDKEAAYVEAEFDL